MIEENKTYLIKGDLLLAVFSYMAKRPWDEVAKAMPQLLDLKQISEIKVDPKQPPDISQLNSDY